MIVRDVGAESARLRLRRSPGTLGGRLTERRLQLGLTQREVAERAGISEASVRHLECNARGLGCSAYTLAHLARALGVSADWLFWGDEYAGNREEAQAS